MTDRGILFSAPMIPPILADIKTVTRRLINPQPFVDGNGMIGHEKLAGLFGAHVFNRCMTSLVPSPYGTAGDRLWVRETWQAIHGQRDLESGHVEDFEAASKIPKEKGRWSVAYAADDCWDDDRGFRWRPGIHMPRWASRIVLDVLSVRVERLHDITEDDAKAEGVEPFFTRFPEIGRDQRITSRELARDAEHRASFACLWDEINGDRALWVSNPWVWRVEFRRVR